jgi:hypothetical protein
VATAHKITQGRGVTVAVIDTGVFVHDDLKDRVLTGMDYTVPTGGNGQVDTDGHGTYIAGLISGRGHGTGLGMLGIAPSARILPLRVAVNRSAWPTDGTVAKAITLARQKGAKIIHLPAMKGDQATMDAVAKAVDAGVLVIAATGNTTYDTQIMPPAAWPGVVAVTGVDQTGKFAPLYVAGAKVDFSAPGVGAITTDKVAGGYVTPASTATASAVTVGVAALVWAKYPKLKAAQVLQAMQKGATDKGAKGRDNQYGYGVVNAGNSLAAAQVIASPSPSASPSLSPSASPTDQAAATDAVAAPPVSDTKDSGGSILPMLGIAGGIVFLLVLAALVVLMIRRSQGGSTPGQPALGAPSPSPWAPQRMQLPQPVSAPVPPPHPGTPPHQAPPYQAPTQQLPMPQQQVAPPGPSAYPQMQPMVNRPPVNAEALNQPTVTIQRPRFSFPGESAAAAEPSIYDTATFPVVEEDRR